MKYLLSGMAVVVGILIIVSAFDDDGIGMLVAAAPYVIGGALVLGLISEQFRNRMGALVVAGMGMVVVAAFIAANQTKIAIFISLVVVAMVAVWLYRRRRQATQPQQHPPHVVVNQEFNQHNH